MKTNVTSAPTFSIFRCSNDVDFCFILSATSLFANKLPCLWWLYFIFSTRSSCRAQEATTCLWVIVVWEHLPGNLFDILLPFVLRGTYFKMHILQRHLVLWPKQNASNKDRRTTKTNLVSQQIYWINIGVCWRHLLSTFLYYLNDQNLTVWMNNQAPKLLCHGWVIGIPERVTWFHLWHAELAEFSFNLGSWSFEQHCVQTNIGDKTIHPFGKPMDSSGASYMQLAGVCFRQHILWEVHSKTISEFGASAIWAASSSIVQLTLDQIAQSFRCFANTSRSAEDALPRCPNALIQQAETYLIREVLRRCSSSLGATDPAAGESYAASAMVQVAPVSSSSSKKRRVSLSSRRSR